MEETKKPKRMILILCLAALAVLALVIFLIVRSSENARHEAIVLPDAPAPVQPQTPPAEQTKPAQIEVREDNVQKVLKSLSRPASYHQSLRILRYLDGEPYEQQSELWVNGSLLRADCRSGQETRSVLTDGTTLYLWYDDSDTVSEIVLDGSISMDDLIGIPTYESILTLDAAYIQKAEFGTPEDSGESCVYVLAEENGTQQEYWVSLDSGLLCRSQTSSKDMPIYRMEQDSLELLGNADEVFSNVFTLPDGTEPFSEE